MVVNSPTYLVVMDDKGFAWSFVQTLLSKQSQVHHIKVPSSTPMRALWSRFSHLSRLVIHWEGRYRKGGAIVEELLELSPSFDVADKIIILTEEPRKEDIVYFSELGLKRIVRLARKGTEFAQAQKELEAQLSLPAFKSKREAFWSNLFKNFDQHLNQIAQPQENKKLSQAFIELLKASAEEDSARALDAKASIAFLELNLESAQEMWLKALEKNVNYFRGYQNLIKLYLFLHDKENAFTLMQRMQQLNHNSIQRLTTMGELQLSLSNEDRANLYFQSALDRDPNCARALNGMAEIYFRREDLEKSKSILSRSTKAGDLASKLNEQGIALVIKEKFEEALHLYTKAHHILPEQEKSARLFYNMGLCLWRWNKPLLAKEYLRIALIKEPGYEKAMKLLEQVEKAMIALPAA